jgi:hypothetical protein
MIYSYLIIFKNYQYFMEYNFWVLFLGEEILEEDS